MSDDICGYEDTTTGEPCRHPADSCPVASHSDEGAENAQGRPKAIDETNKEAIYEAARLGLTVKHQAAIGGVHPDTLRRATCCLETLREPELSTDDPCDFCEGYVRAHGEGARNVLEECRPEFRASATFGYTKTERREHAGDAGNPLELVINDSIREVTEE